MSIHITKEAMKAETTIRRIRKNAEAAKRHTAEKWVGKEQAYVAGLAPEVQRTLMVAGVVESVRCFDASEAIDVTVLSSVDEETVEEAELLS